MIAKLRLFAALAAMLLPGAAALAQDRASDEASAPRSEAAEAPRAQAMTSAAATAGRLHEGLVEVAARHVHDPVGVRYDALLPIVTTTRDLPCVAEFSNRREWRELPEAERERFDDASVRLRLATYARRSAGLEAGMFSL